MNGDHALPIVKVSQDLEPQLVRDLAQKSSLSPAQLHLDADPGQLGAPAPLLPRQLDAQSRRDRFRRRRGLDPTKAVRGSST